MDREETLIERRRRMARESMARVRARRSRLASSQQESREETPIERRRRNARERQERSRANRQQQSNEESLAFTDEVQQHNCGPMNDICQYCGSQNFITERPSDGKFTSCCRKGKVKLMTPVDATGNILNYPIFLSDLLSNADNPDYANFRQHIRSYNSALSFASMGAKLEEFHDRGPFIFKVHGQIVHRTSHVEPVNGQAPQYAQLYVIDSTQATEIRVSHPANEQCIPRVLDQIDRFLRQNNRLCDAYRMLREVQAQAVAETEMGQEIPAVNLVFRRDRHSDQRRYNVPNQNEIAMVFVNNDGEPPFERDIRVYPINPANQNQPFININILSPNLDPMTYPLFFPFGEPGWQPNWSCEAYDGAQRNRTRVNVTMLQYKAALLAIREGFNPIISAGKLTQQWIVDSYLQVEANNLNFIRTHQRQLRTELFQGLADHIEISAGNADIRAGIPMILPSSFEGSPRNMRERCADAMSIFAKFGPPDIFITFTANPKWLEITENLKRGEHFFFFCQIFKV